MFGGRKKLVMCQVCRGLIEASTTTCPLCGRESVPKARISAEHLTAGGNFFSLVILTINIILFVLMSIVEVRGGRGAEAFFESASNGVLDDFGALVPHLVREGQWWRLVSCNFLHIGLMHLLFNSSALFYIGPQVEDTFGSQKFVFAYVGTGVASGVASYLFLPAGSAGASGAIFGLIGLMAAYGYKLGGSFGRELMRRMLIWAGVGIVFGFFIGANNVAHVGGLVAGGALGLVLAPDAPSTVGSAAAWNATAIACIGLVAISFVLAGRVYGTEQEKWNQREVKLRQSRNAFKLVEVIEAARESVDQSFNIINNPAGVHREDAVEIAAELRRRAAEVEKEPAIDERSTAIKQRLVELIKKRAKSFEDSVDASMIAAAASADREAFDSVFDDFTNWIESEIESLPALK